MISVFTRGLSDNLASLVKQIDDAVDKNKKEKMAAFVVLLSEDADADAEKLTKLAAEKGIANTPLTIFDGIAGPAKYKIAEKADVTVVMWTGGKFTVTHAFEKGKLNAAAIKIVIADIEKILK